MPSNKNAPAEPAQVTLPKLDDQCKRELAPLRNDNACVVVVLKCRERQLLAALQLNQQLQTELKALTKDRNLWKDDHENECPYVALNQQQARQIYRLTRERDVLLTNRFRIGDDAIQKVNEMLKQISEMTDTEVDAAIEKEKQG